MKFIALTLFVFACANLWAQDTSVDIDNASKSSLFTQAFSLYKQGKYNDTVAELNQVEQRIASNNKSQLGLISYWKGLCYNRSQDYEASIQSFSRALGLDYAPQDIHYEYGQALFAANKLEEARLQFRESLTKKFKRAVSLYYIAFVSRELGEKKKAVTFFKAIEKLDAEEAKEVRQAAEMQIGDIYLEQVEKHPDSFRAVENYVIPQYKLAYEVDRDSSLAPQILEKIVKLQRKYDLVMFKLRNGRATMIPPYFLRLAAEIGQDSNVTYSPAEQEIAESKKRSAYSKFDTIGRYTFYYKDYISVAPEFRFNYTRYLNRVKEIYRNDNMLVAPALRSAYEHKLWDKPASVMFDYDYSDIKRDVDEEQKLKFASRSHTLMLGERFNYFSSGESIVRFRHRIFDSYSNDSDSKTNSFVFEQIKSYSLNTLLLYFSYDMSRVKDEVYDTNSFTARADLILPRYKDWFTPSFGFAITRTDPINNDDRGIEYLYNPNIRLSKTFNKHYRGNLKFDYSDNKSDDTENFAYKKYVYSFELEYLF